MSGRRFLVGCFLGFGLCLALAPDTEAADRGNLYGLYHGGPAVRVYVSEIQNTADADADLDGFKSQLENALLRRKSISFELAPKAEASDITMEMTLIEFFWTEDDPVDMITSAPLLAYDVMTKENYARLRVRIKVKDSKSNKTLWEDTVKSTITDNALTQEDSFARAGEEWVDHFMGLCFGKKYSKA